MTGEPQPRGFEVLGKHRIETSSLRKAFFMGADMASSSALAPMSPTGKLFIRFEIKATPKALVKSPRKQTNG